MFRCNLLLIFMLGLPSFVAHAKEPVFIELNATGKPPLNTPDQRGFMDLVAKEALSRIGITLKTISLPAERGILDSNAGLLDGELVRIKGLDKTYTNLIRVPEKIMDWEFYAFSNKPIKITQGWSDLKSHSIAIITGWKILERNVPPEAELTKVKVVSQLFNLLSKNRVDMVLYERWGGLLSLTEHNIPDVHLLTPPLAVREMFIYLHKKHKAIIPKLAAALKSMKQDGSYQNIYKQILAPYDSYPMTNNGIY